MFSFFKRNDLLERYQVVNTDFSVVKIVDEVASVREAMEKITTLTKQGGSFAYRKVFRAAT